MATKEPSQLIVEGDSGNPQKPPAVAAAAAATADASVTVTVVDDDAVRERKEERERGTERESVVFRKKTIPNN